MDISEAFDLINHDLFVAKFHAYGFSNDSIKFLYSYLIDGIEKKLIINLVHGKS